jgi:predicted nucleic acid-binding protein
MGRFSSRPAVITELNHEHTPVVVRQWMAGRSEWLRVQSPSTPVVSARLGPGELEAITLAVELSADALLIDERDGRAEAERRGVAVLGTLRVLADAAQHGLADLPAVLERLKHTNFRASEQLIQWLLDRGDRR